MLQRPAIAKAPLRSLCKLVMSGQAQQVLVIARKKQTSFLSAAILRIACFLPLLARDCRTLESREKCDLPCSLGILGAARNPG
jgi:hypothetical protein